MDSSITADWRADLCEDLSKGLFANEDVCRTRLKLNMAMVCSVSCSISLPNSTHQSIQTALPTDDAFKDLLLSLQRHIHIFCILVVFKMLCLLPVGFPQGLFALLP